MSANWLIKIVDDGFIHQDIKYLYDEVAHIYSSEVLTSQRVNVFLKVGEANTYSVKIILKNQREIKIVIDENTIFIGYVKDKSSEIRDLKYAVARIQSATFDSRLNSFELEIRSKGYFIYDECFFYVSPIKKITFRSKDFLLSESTLLNYGFAIELRPKAYGWKEKLIRANSPFKTPQFNIQTDTDVIYYLLKKYFGLSW